MIGDVIDKDILPAVALGWGGIWITPHVEKTKSSSLVNLQDLLTSAHAIQDTPLSIGWADINI